MQIVAGGLSKKSAFELAGESGSPRDPGEPICSRRRGGLAVTVCTSGLC